MRRDASSPTLILALSLKALACSAPSPATGPPVQAKAPATWRHHNEEEWMVTEIAGSIGAMTTFARHPPKPATSDWSVLVLEDPQVAGSGASLKPLRLRLIVGRDRTERTLDIGLNLFASAAWAPLAAALLPPPGAHLPASLLPDATLLGALTDLRAEVLIAEARRVSDALESDMLDPSAHEQAALILGAFALREAAGRFSDIRPAAGRITAHLAMARALRAGADEGLAGRYAEIILSALVNRQREALTRIEALAKDAGSAQGAWLASLRLRATGDWRAMPDTKGATLLERLELFRARTERLSTDVTSAEFQKHPGEPIADWGRSVMSHPQGPTVTDCGLFGSSLVASELSELAMMQKASGEPTPSTPPEIVTVLSERPRTGGVSLDGDRLSFAVLDRGLRAAFLERHLMNALRKEYACLDWAYGLPEQAVAYARQARERYAGLRLFNLIAGEMVHDSKDPAYGYREAIGVLEAEPERVTASNWTALRSNKRYPQLMSSLPDEGLWFSTGFLRGTTYDSWFRLNKMKTLRVVRLEDKAAFREISPYDYWVVWAQIWKLFNEKPVLEVVEREAGALFDYDGRLLGSMARAWKTDLARYKPVGRRLAELNPRYWSYYADTLVDLGDEGGGLAAYREMALKTPDEVQVSNHLGWLVNYEFEHGREREAFRLASRAADTGSAAGYMIMSRLLEKSGRLERSFGYLREVQERYGQRQQMVALYLRNKDHFKGSEVEHYVEPVFRELFANGLESVALASLSGPPRDGILVKWTSRRMDEAGVKPGAILVAVDGLRVRNEEQYRCVRALADTTTLHLIAWQNDAYVELTPTLVDRLPRNDLDIASYQR